MSRGKRASRRFLVLMNQVWLPAGVHLLANGRPGSSFAGGVVTRLVDAPQRRRNVEKEEQAEEGNSCEVPSPPGGVARSQHPPFGLKSGVLATVFGANPGLARALLLGGKRSKYSGNWRG
ncbi:hypothetical protein VZT92_015151 [Zoarces viviparus]|uniref:Secreted protein n=1 Tax=Zoarces viviparus TaxID=48416 RepID=A0AAW1EVW2_ZOAVI